MTQYTKFTPTPNGLLIELTDEGKEAAADFLERLKTESYYILWWDLNEWEFCNGWYDGRDIFPLYSGPVITSDRITDKTTSREVSEMKVYYFPDYAIRSELDELLTNGSILFTLAT